jgi:hypothetical protein
MNSPGAFGPGAAAHRILMRFSRAARSILRASEVSLAAMSLSESQQQQLAAPHFAAASLPDSEP